MQIGFVGLGRMGGNMVTRLRQGGHEVVAFDFSPEAVARAEQQGASGVGSLEALVAALAAPRRIWIMVPLGRSRAADARRARRARRSRRPARRRRQLELPRHQRRGAELAERGVRFCDVGHERRRLGARERLLHDDRRRSRGHAGARAALDTLAPPDGWLHVGPIGAGHYVKMVHNGIEYGMLQAYGEGYEILRRRPVPSSTSARSRSSGTRARSSARGCYELAERAFANGSELEGVRGYVDDSGEGRWTVRRRSIRDARAGADAVAARALRVAPGRVVRARR